MDERLCSNGHTIPHFITLYHTLAPDYHSDLQRGLRLLIEISRILLVCGSHSLSALYSELLGNLYDRQSLRTFCFCAVYALLAF